MTQRRSRISNKAILTAERGDLYLSAHRYQILLEVAWGGQRDAGGYLRLVKHSQILFMPLEAGAANIIFAYHEVCKQTSPFAPHKFRPK